MPVIACRVLTAEPHPNADRLSVYTVEVPGVGPIQIIANKENSYEVGDVAAAALVGTELPGGPIREVKMRGVQSFGMLLGKIADEPGTDVTARYAAAAE